MLFSRLTDHLNPSPSPFVSRRLACVAAVVAAALRKWKNQTSRLLSNDEWIQDLLNSFISRERAACRDLKRMACRWLADWR